MEENKGAVMTFLVISATIEWLEQHHERAKLIKEQKERDKKEAEDAILLVRQLFLASSFGWPLNCNNWFHHFAEKIGVNKSHR